MVKRAEAEEQEAFTGLAAEGTPQEYRQEIAQLLIDLTEQGCTLITNKGFLERLTVRPRNLVTEEQVKLLKRHKVRIVQLLQDRAYQKTGEIQCERHAFELARAHFKKGMEV